jgi:hypothetical protein
MKQEKQMEKAGKMIAANQARKTNTLISFWFTGQTLHSSLRSFLAQSGEQTVRPLSDVLAQDGHTALPQ